MIDRLIVLIVDEGKWLTASMGLALLAVAILFYHAADLGRIASARHPAMV